MRSTHRLMVVMTTMDLITILLHLPVPLQYHTPYPLNNHYHPLVNPLVSAGPIPKRLEDLQVPQRNRQQTRVVTKVRVIMGDEYMEELQENEAKENKEAKQRRRERE